MSLRLRDYQPSDFDTLWALDQSCFASDISYTRSEMRLYLALRSAFCIVAELDNKIAGFIIVDSRPPRPAYVVTIDVAQEHRRAGIATALFDASEARLCKQGSTAMRLEVAEDNLPAIEFYRRKGFIEIGRKPDYYGGRLAALSLRKELAAT